MKTEAKTTNEPEEQYSSNEDYIRACYDALAALEELDAPLLGKGYAERKKALQIKIFDMLEKCTSDMYEEIFFEQEAANPDNPDSDCNEV